MDINFKQVLGEGGNVDPSLIMYFDGSVWWMVVVNGQFWDVYQQWLAEGNTPLAAA